MRGKGGGEDEEKRVRKREKYSDIHQCLRVCVSSLCDSVIRASRQGARTYYFQTETSEDMAR